MNNIINIINQRFSEILCLDQNYTHSTLESFLSDILYDACRVPIGYVFLNKAVTVGAWIQIQELWRFLCKVTTKIALFKLRDNLEKYWCR